MCLLFCFVLFWIFCCVVCEKKKKKIVDNKKKIDSINEFDIHTQNNKINKIK